MSELTTIDGEPVKNHGWRVALAGVGINLATKRLEAQMALLSLLHAVGRDMMALTQ